jgi:hypothetical protein
MWLTDLCIAASTNKRGCIRLAPEVSECIHVYVCVAGRMVSECIWICLASVNALEEKEQVTTFNCLPDM